MSDAEALMKLMTMTPEARERLLADILDATPPRTVLGLVFTHHGDDWWCNECEHDILITPSRGTYTVYVHEKSDKAEVVAGPFTALSFDFCVSWAKGRCGLLPDQMTKLLERAGSAMACFACKEPCTYDARGKEAECHSCGFING